MFWSLKRTKSTKVRYPFHFIVEMIFAVYKPRSQSPIFISTIHPPMHHAFFTRRSCRGMICPFRRSSRAMEPAEACTRFMATLDREAQPCLLTRLGCCQTYNEGIGVAYTCKGVIWGAVRPTMKLDHSNGPITTMNSGLGWNGGLAPYRQRLGRCRICNDCVRLYQRNRLLEFPANIYCVPGCQFCGERSINT